MIQQVNLKLDCTTVGDFTDEAELPSEFAHLKTTQVRGSEASPWLPAGYLADHRNQYTMEREFTVLPKDTRVVSVRGHALRVLEAPQHDSLYEITSNVGKKEIVVALRILDVSGVFNGKISHG